MQAQQGAHAVLTRLQVTNEARLSAVLGQRSHPALATCITSGHLHLASTASQASWIQGAHAVVVAPCGKPLVPPGCGAPVMTKAEAERMVWQILGALAVLQVGCSEAWPVGFVDMHWWRCTDAHPYVWGGASNSCQVAWLHNCQHALCALVVVFAIYHSIF